MLIYRHNNKKVTLQSVFIIRSVNDPYLRKGSNLVLITFSLIASVISIANKYSLIDEDAVEDEYKKLRAKAEFPKNDFLKI